MLQFMSRFMSSLVTVAALCACATTGQVPSTTQPALSKYAEPYGDGMRKVGIQSVMVYGNGARVRVATRAGEVYFRYPGGLAQTDFALYLLPQGVEVDSDAANAGNLAQYEAAFKVILPEAIKQTAENNVVQAEEGLGGRGGRGGGR